MFRPKRPWRTLFLAATSTWAQSLPYNAGRVFTSPNSSFAYLFSAGDDSTSTGFYSLALTDRPIQVASAEFNILYDTLPFLEDVAGTSITPVSDGRGNITVLAGKCEQGHNGLEIWTFVPEEKDPKGNGTWTKYPVDGRAADGDVLSGANYLANGLAFSSYVQGGNANTSMYVFGGMCPYANTTDGSWTTAADYSNQMLVADPSSGDDGSSIANYQMSIATTDGPPIAEAGFSITGLPSSLSFNPNGGATRQQQSFVLLGGHTQSAFINMSQVALFSLPQESWMFLPVDQPNVGQSRFAPRDGGAAQVEPRSGHTAVLNEDGNSIVVLGGWVGDVTNAAKPQLAILEMGSGYGGSGDWMWTVPETSGNGLDATAGIFGHGATLLDGNIMIIFDGFSIPATSSRLGRRDIQRRQEQTLLFNITSLTWIDSYTAPDGSYYRGGDQSSSVRGSVSTTSQKTGLGVGLAVGFVLLIALVLFYFWYTRRLHRVREDRARRAMTHSSNTFSVGPIGQPFLHRHGVDDDHGEMSAVRHHWEDENRASYNAYPWDASGREGAYTKPRDAGSTGLFLNLPSPTRGLRKGIAARPYSYHQAPRNEEKRLSGSGYIHTIAEHDDEDASSARASRDRFEAERPPDDKERAETRARPWSDPFADPRPNPLGSHPVSPELGDAVKRMSAQIPGGPSPPRTSRGESEHISHSMADDPLLLLNDGRSSPSKSHSEDRTSSNLSERSNRSHASNSSITRTMSTRTGAILSAAAAAMANRGYELPSPGSAAMSIEGRPRLPYPINTKNRSPTAQSGAPQSAGTDADSFVTAKSIWRERDIQAEGEALLGGRPGPGRDDPYGRAMATICSKPSNGLSSDTAFIAPQIYTNRRRQGLVGSLRKALGAMAPTGRSMSLSTNSDKPHSDQTPLPSPMRERRNPIGTTPRRAISDGGALLRQKRGAMDWRQEENKWPPYRDDPDGCDWGEQRSSMDKQQAEEEWDVEDAASKRDVQVMFTVPKARLRVVNADVDRASLRSASDSALSCSDSLRRDDSIRDLKPRSDAERATVLPATVEEKEEPLVRLADEMAKRKAA